MHVENVFLAVAAAGMSPFQGQEMVQAMVRGIQNSKEVQTNVPEMDYAAAADKGVAVVAVVVGARNPVPNLFLNG